MSDWRHLTDREKLDAINNWLESGWKEKQKKLDEVEDQSADYYFYLGEKSIIEDLQFYIDYALKSCMVDFEPLK